MVALDSIIEELRRPMFDTWQNHTKSWRIALGFVGRDPFRLHARLVDRTLEESLSSLGVAPLREIRVNHLTRVSRLTAADADLKCMSAVLTPS